MFIVIRMYLISSVHALVYSLLIRFLELGAAACDVADMTQALVLAGGVVMEMIHH